MFICLPVCLRVSTYREKMHILHSDVGSNDTIVTISTLWDFMLSWRLFTWIIIALPFLPYEQARDYEMSVELLHYNFDFLFCSYDEIENTLWIKLGSLARCSVSYWYQPKSAAAVQPPYPTDHKNSFFHLITLPLKKRYQSFSILMLLDIFSWIDDTKFEPKCFVHHWSIIKVIHEWLLRS